MPVENEERVYFAPEQQFRGAVDILFGRVAVRIRALLPNSDIQHVGSTAVPGSLTKGDLDVQVRVAPAEFAAAKERLSQVYSVNTGGFVGDEAISFEDYSTQPPLGIHLTVAGGKWDLQWKFRDLLLESPVLCDEYDRLKRRFHGGSMEKYREAKTAFVSRVLLDAGALDAR
jgi:GrpB-like predicted nucleotidyltransferase (UPF0157 family)